jgi:transcriptional regulator with XRE-family HTH domain
MRELIRKLRKQHGLSQAQLAEKIGKARSTVTMYELGVNIVPIPVLYDLARVFDVPITTFFDIVPPNGQEPPHG